MKCKRCGVALPNEGFLCSHCGMMMSKEQIEEQKKYMQQNFDNHKVELVSEKYGGKKQIFQKREESDKKYIWIFYLL